MFVWNPCIARSQGDYDYEQIVTWSTSLLSCFENRFSTSLNTELRFESYEEALLVFFVCFVLAFLEF